MRILLVEDDINFARPIDKAIRAIEECELTWVRSRDSALAKLNDDVFDVVILDRRIPTDDDILDEHEDHGWAVFQAVAEGFPGTCVWFLTGTVDADFPVELLKMHGRQGDIHCKGADEPVHQVFWKHNMLDCVAAVRAFRASINVTEQVRVTHAGAPTNLRFEEARLIRLFGRKHQGVRVEVRPLTGGLSGAKVVRVTAFDGAGAPLITSVGKLGTFSEIAVEREKYRSEVIKLTAGSFPQVTADIGLGAGNFGGIFYGVVGGDVTSLFDVLVDNLERASEVPALLRTDQATWHGARQIESVRIASIRRLLLSDMVLHEITNELTGIDIGSIEKLEVQTARCVQHGDLHCANVLFDNHARPMVIDYSDIKRSVASLDPVTLELSTIFHKDAPARAGWPSQPRAEAWADIALFASGSPHEAFIHACRDWARGVAGSEEEVWAVGYSYALRQLKYRDTDKELARALIKGCIARLSSAAS